MKGMTATGLVSLVSASSSAFSTVEGTQTTLAFSITANSAVLSDLAVARRRSEFSTLACRSTRK